MNSSWANAKVMFLIQIPKNESGAPRYARGKSVVNPTLKKMKYEVILMTSCRVHDAVSQRLGIDGWSSRAQARCAAVLESSLLLGGCAVPRNHAANQT